MPYKCNLCDAEYDHKPKRGRCPAPRCKGNVTLVPDKLPEPEMAKLPEDPANDVRYTGLVWPTSVAAITPNFITRLKELYEIVYGKLALEHGEYTLLIKLERGAAQPTLAHLSTLGTLLCRLQPKYQAKRDRNEFMSQKVEELLRNKGDRETIYRNCSIAEANDAASSGQLRQGEDSFDKYKWIFIDDKNPPVEDKHPPRRLHMQVPRGTTAMLQAEAAQHTKGNDQAIVTRDRNDSASAATTDTTGETHEPGAYAIHDDVLEVFSKLIYRIENKPNP